MARRFSIGFGARNVVHQAARVTSAAMALACAAQLSAATTYYWDLNGTTAGAGGPSPSGTWDNGVSANWGTGTNGPAGTATTVVYANSGTSSSAVFSAGTDATGAYDVTVSGTISVVNMTFEEGSVTLKGTNTPALQVFSTVTVNAGSGPIVFDSSLGSLNSGSPTVNSNVWTNNDNDVLKINCGLTMRSSTTRFFTFVPGAGGVEVNGVISAGSGSKLIVSGAAATDTVSLNNANTYTAATEVRGGTLKVGNNSALSSSAVLLNGGTLEVPAGRTISNAITVGGQVGGTGSVYSGTLRVNGTIQTGALTFTQGTITGSGTINQAMTIGTGMSLSPGNSPGTLNGSSQTWAGGGTYKWEINSVGGSAGSTTGWDLLNLTGGLTISSTSGSPFVIEVTSLDAGNNSGAVPGFSASSNYKWLIADAANSIAYNSATDLANFSISHAAFDTLNGSGSGSWSVVRGDEGAVGGDSTQLYLTYTVPEPGALALAGMGAAGLLVSRRRSRRAD